MDIVPLFKTLADANRIKIAAAIMDRHRTIDEIAVATQLSPRLVQRHLAALQAVGLADLRDERPHRRYRFRQEPLFEALKGLAETPAGPDLDDDTDAFDRKVLTDFLVDGRLKVIPAQDKKRQAVLRYLARRFEPERMYDEREVNSVLKEVFDDVASLRRYLVDGGYLNRQVIREVEAQALVEGTPRVEHRLMYWKPDGEGGE